MAALTGQTIATSYEQLLHVDVSGGGTTTTHVSVKDGDNGTTFGFTIATDALMMTGTNRLEFNDVGEYIYGNGDDLLMYSGADICLIPTAKAGIGTGTPGAKLEIFSSSYDLLKLANNAADYGLFTVNTSGAMEIATTSATANDGHIHLDPASGHVGINVATPQKSLEVVSAVVICQGDDATGDSGAALSLSHSAMSWNISYDRSDEGTGWTNVLSFAGGAGTPYVTVGSSGITPGYRLHTEASISAGQELVHFNNSRAGIVDGDNILELKFGGDSGVTSGGFIIFADSDTPEIGIIHATGAGDLAFVNNSDYRLKENIVPITKGLAEINNLKPSEFRLKATANSGVYETNQGFIAHEVQEAGLGVAINGVKDAMKVDNKEYSPTFGQTIPDYQGIDPSKLIPAMVKAIQELSTKVTALENA